jgi:hypothetical protein
VLSWECGKDMLEDVHTGLWDIMNLMK